MGILDWIDEDTYQAFKRKQREERERERAVTAARVDETWRRAQRGDGGLDFAISGRRPSYEPEIVPSEPTGGLTASYEAPTYYASTPKVSEADVAESAVRMGADPWQVAQQQARDDEAALEAYAAPARFLSQQVTKPIAGLVTEIGRLGWEGMEKATDTGSGLATELLGGRRQEGYERRLGLNRADSADPAERQKRRREMGIAYIPAGEFLPMTAAEVGTLARGLQAGLKAAPSEARAAAGMTREATQAVKPVAPKTGQFLDDVAKSPEVEALAPKLGMETTEGAKGTKPKITNALSGRPMGVAPETVGAVGGLGGAIATDDPNMTPEERRDHYLRWTLGGALGTAGLKGGAKGIGQVVQKVGRGLGVEDASKLLEETAKRIDEIDTRLSEIEPILEKAEGARMARAARREAGGTIQRPPFAGRLTNEQLEEVARTHDVSPYQNAWWEALDPEAFKELGPGRRSDKYKLPDLAERNEDKTLNAEWVALNKERDQLMDNYDVGYEAALAKPEALASESLRDIEKVSKTIRFEAGKKLTSAQRKDVLRAVVDVYKAKQAPKVVKGIDRRGEEIIGYEYNPDYFEVSDVTRKPVRYYITLPDGRKAHPSELYPELTDAAITKAIAEEQSAAKQAAAHAADLEQRRTARIIGADTAAPERRTKANERYAKTGRTFAHSFFAQNGDGAIVRVDGTSQLDIDYYVSKGFAPITQPVPPREGDWRVRQVIRANINDVPSDVLAQYPDLAPETVRRPAKPEASEALPETALSSSAIPATPERPVAFVPETTALPREALPSGATPAGDAGSIVPPERPPEVAGLKGGAKGIGQVVQKVGRGLGVEDVTRGAKGQAALDKFNQLLEQFNGLNERVAKLDDDLLGLRNERRDRSESLGIFRPSWGVGWTDEELIELAARSGIPTEDLFRSADAWDAVDQAAKADFDPFRRGGGKSAKLQELAAEIRRLTDERREVMEQASTIHGQLGVAWQQATPEGVAEALGRSDVPELAAETLERAKGTPGQAAQLRPPEEGFASNIRLEKFEEAGVSDLIKRTMENPDLNEFAGQRRGVITDQQALQNAAEKALGTTVQDWLKSKPGRAFNQEEAIALGNTLAKSGQDYDALLTKVLEARDAGTVNATMEAELADKALEFAALAAVRSGAAAEAGRTLRSFRQALSGEGASAVGATREKAIQQAFKVLGGTEQFAKWVEEFSKIPVNDVAARYKMLQALHTPTLWDKINAWRYASMLSSYKTHMVNFISNAAEAIDRPTDLLLAGYPQEAKASMYGLLRGVPEGMQAAKDAFAMGVSRFEVGTGTMESVRPRALGSGRVGRTITAGSDALMASDDLWKQINFSGSIYEQAYRAAKGNVAEASKLIENPSKEMVEEAMQRARTATFTSDPHPWLNQLIKLVNTPGPAGTITKFVLPFVRTPANIYIRGLDTLLRPMITGPVRMGVKVAKGDMRGLRIEAAKTVKASALLAGLWAMAQAGDLTGQGPSDPAKRRILEESGWQPNSIRLFGRWIGYGNFGPVSVPLAGVAAVKEGLEEGQRPNHEMLVDMTTRLHSSMLDASFLRGLADLLRAENPAAWATQNAASILGSFVPYGAGLAAVERIVDPTVRAKDDPLKAVQGRIPGVSQFLPAEPSIYGGERQTGAGDTFWQIALPWQSSTLRGDPVAREVARLNQSPEARQAGVSVSARQFGEDFAGAKQTPEQRRLLQREAGKLAATYISDMIGRESYQGLDDAQKAATLNKMLGTAYELADLQLGEKLNRDERHKALLAWASVPQYEGVKGTPEQVREQNFRVSQAKAKLAEYRKAYGEDRGEYRLMKEDKQAFQLAQRGRLDSDYLRLKKKRIDDAFGGALSQTERRGLVGAGNTFVPIGGR